MLVFIVWSIFIGVVIGILIMGALWIYDTKQFVPLLKWLKKFLKIKD